MKLPLGFRYSSLYAGIRKRANGIEKDDLGLIVSGAPASAAGQPCCTSRKGSKTPTRHTSEPIDRSMPAVMMTNAAPTLRMPNKAVRCTSLPGMRWSLRRS